MTKSTKRTHPTANDLIDALDIYFPEVNFATFRELNVEGPDEGHNLGKGPSFSRIDYWAMTHFNSLPPRREIAGSIYAIEVKVDRRDFTEELKIPQKQRWALMYSNLFYYCAPRGLIHPQELPPYAGLMEYENGSITRIIEAPWHDAMPPRWTFVASLLAPWSRTKRLSRHSKANEER
jgi:hypothetical protein